MTTNYCTQCSAKLEINERFCSQCGERVTPVRQKPPDSRQNNRTFFTPPVVGIVLLGALLLIVGALAFMFNRPEPTPVVTLPDNHNEAGLPYPEVERIALDEAEKRYDAGEAVFVDVRDREAYEAAHVPNAISIPLGELTTRYQELPRDTEIITYCT